MKLPHAELAIVEIAKLRDYSLDGSHEEGKHKTRVFAAALGIGSPIETSRFRAHEELGNANN